ERKSFKNLLLNGCPTFFYGTLQTPPYISEIHMGYALVLRVGLAHDKTRSLHTNHHPGCGGSLNPHYIRDLLLGQPIVVPQALQKHFLPDMEMMFTQIVTDAETMD